MWELLSEIALLGVSLVVVYQERRRNEQRWLVFFMAGVVFYGSVREIGFAVIRWWLHR